MFLVIALVLTLLSPLHIGDTGKNLSTDDFQNRIIRSKDALKLNACGKDFSPSGTTGTFTLVDPSDNDRVIRKFEWDCPFGSSENTWKMTDDSNPNFIVECKGGSFLHGALGDITVEVINKEYK